MRMCGFRLDKGTARTHIAIGRLTDRSEDVSIGFVITDGGAMEEGTPPGLAGP
jgi:hypothetical protein